LWITSVSRKSSRAALRKEEPEKIQHKIVQKNYYLRMKLGNFKAQNAVEIKFDIWQVNVN